MAPFSEIDLRTFYGGGDLVWPVWKSLECHARPPAIPRHHAIHTAVGIPLSVRFLYLKHFPLTPSMTPRYKKNQPHRHREPRTNGTPLPYQDLESPFGGGARVPTTTLRVVDGIEALALPGSPFTAFAVGPLYRDFPPASGKSRKQKPAFRAALVSFIVHVHGANDAVRRGLITHSRRAVWAPRGT